MSGQDVGFFDVGTECPDIVIENGDLKPDNTLITPAFISMFSDKRVTLEELPPGLDDRRGWWADLISEPLEDQIGSRLWTLDRSKILDSTPAELENIMSEALNWMLEDGIAQRVVVTAARNGLNEVTGTARVFRPDGEEIPFKFIWDGQELKLTGE